MAHAISIDRSAIWAMQHGRLEDLKTRNLSTPDNQQPFGEGDLNKIMDHDLYKATKEEDIDKFIDALEKVSQSRKLALSQIFDQVTPAGNSLLHVAASCGREDVMELILFHYPYLVTRKNSWEDTPLHVAVQHGMFNAARMLIRLRRDSEIVYWKNKDSKSPLFMAVENYWLSNRENPNGAVREILQLLLQESARDEAYAVKIQGMSPVLTAIQVGEKGGSSNNYSGMLKEIVDRLPKLLHVRDENGGTPLHVAASVENYYAVELLLEKCPQLALQTDKNGSYPIHIACEEWRFEGWTFEALRQLIIGTWSDPAEIKNKEDQNILHVAAKAGNYRAVSCICKEYSKPGITEKLVNSKDVHGNTPLHLASMHNHRDVMRFLTLTMNKRIDLRLRNNDGLTALDVAMESRSLSTTTSALVGRAILIVAGVPRNKRRGALSPREQGSGASKSSHTEWIKDQVNTLLLVATLVASITFTAGLTLPGGYNASDDLHPGMATMLHHGMFQIFVIANMVAMYSSILAVVVLLWGLNRDFYVAELAHHSAGPLLLMALTGMSVAFFAAVTVAVSKLTWLGSLVLSVGVLYLVMVVVVLAALIFPSFKATMHIVVFYYIFGIFHREIC